LPRHDPQQALNPAGDLRVERFGSTFGPDDKVKQMKNDFCWCRYGSAVFCRR
jgi:hypothetical protein